MNKIAEIHNDDEYVRLWNIESINDSIFVTHITKDSSTRYEFIEVDNQKSVVYTKEKNTTPPRIVVEILNENGYNVTNIPNINEKDLVLRIKQVMNALEWIEKHGNIDDTDIRRNAYGRASTGMPVIYYGVITRKYMGPKNFVRELDKCIQDNNLQFTKEEMIESRICNIELRQRMIVQIKKSLPIESQKEIDEIVKELEGEQEPSSLEESEKRWAEAREKSTNVQISHEARRILKKEGWI